MSTRPLPALYDAQSGCICASLAHRFSLPVSEVSDRLVDRTADIANRLRFVCAHLTPEELLELARRMAIVEMKYASAEERDAELECA